MQLLGLVLIIVGLWALVSCNGIPPSATFICSVIGSVQCALTGYNSSKRLCDHNISLGHHHGFAHDRGCYWGCTCCEIRESISFKVSVSLNIVNGTG